MIMDLLWIGAGLVGTVTHLINGDLLGAIAFFGLATYAFVNYTENRLRKKGA